MNEYEKKMNEFLTNSDENCLFSRLDQIAQHFNMKGKSYQPLSAQEYRLKIKTEIEKNLANYVTSYKKENLSP